ncbi:MAG: amino acid permease, partial [Myxococcales bacterium]|nr:amino acid permease [Myxococcales bacterium]
VAVAVLVVACPCALGLAVPLGVSAGLGALAVWGVAAGGADLVVPERPLGDVGTAWLGVYFAYAGWPAVVYLAGEVRDPGRTLPLAVLGGTALIAAFYALLCAAFLAVLGFDGLAGAGEAGTALAAALLGPSGAVVMAFLVALAVLASINATLLGGARVLWAVAGAVGIEVLQPLTARGTPARALALPAVLAASLCLLAGFEGLMSAATVAMLVAGSVTVSAQVVLRARQPDLPRPFRAPLHPLPAVVYVLSALGAVALLVGQ